MNQSQELILYVDPDTSSEQDQELQPAPSDPTKDTYEELNRAYEFFNQRLFNGELPSCMITLRARGKVLGYYCGKRFLHPDGRVTAEIALNPEAAAYRSIVQCLSTLVHEQVHLYQDHLNVAPRKAYHNKLFAQQMLEVGLITSSTGRPGGSSTGQKMSHYIEEGGPFELAARELIAGGFKALWFDRLITNVSYGYNPFEPEPPAPAPKAPKNAVFDADPDVDDDDSDDDDSDDDDSDDDHDQNDNVLLEPMSNLATIEKMQKLNWKEGDKPAILDNLGKVELREPVKKDTSKTKFRCMKCGCQAWAKDSIQLKCGACDLKMYRADELVEVIKPDENKEGEDQTPTLLVDTRQLPLLPPEENDAWKGDDWIEDQPTIYYPSATDLDDA